MPTTIQLPTPGPVQHPRRQAQRAVAVAAGAAGLLALAGGGLAVANNAMSQHDQRSFTAIGIRDIRINVDAGDLTLLHGPARRKAAVDPPSDLAGNQPGPRHTVKKGVLTLSG